MKIAIAGYGIEGEANYRYFSSMPGVDITIVDESEKPKFDLPQGVKTILGQGAFTKLQDFDLVVRTASLPPHKIKTNGKIWSATNEFLDKCPAPIIGITGTKGKGTTSSMIASIMEAAGHKVWLVGNIGIPSLEVLEKVKPNDVVVYEMSSFQLWDVEKSPHISVVLGIEPEHLDVHKDFDDYVGAKANIRRFQTADDFCVYKFGDLYSEMIADKSEAPSLAYGLDAKEGAHVKGEFFYVGDEAICATHEVQLRGLHNIENACAAIDATYWFGISKEDIAAGLRDFHGLPHRLEFVANIEGVSYYNDSFSSSTPAVMAAVDAFTESEILIIGGVDRGGDFENLAERLSHRDNIKEIILIGEIRSKLADIFRSSGMAATITEIDAKSMRDIVKYANSRAVEGDVIVLSPGCASFDMFKDFYDRGDQFRREVQGLAHRNDTFVFDRYEFDPSTGQARFFYHFDRVGGDTFVETVQFKTGDSYDPELLDRALKLAFLLMGTSYYKSFPTKHVHVPGEIDDWQSEFLNNVYQEGLSQFAFENGLTRSDLAHFKSGGLGNFSFNTEPVPVNSTGTLALQSGGKDSLLTAVLLEKQHKTFTPWYLASSDYHPKILDDLGQDLLTSQRKIDLNSIKSAIQNGGRNGHVPVTYIVQSLALVQAILLGLNEVLVSIAHEGEEAHAEIGDLSVTHQWSKTWGAEQLFAEYVKRYISDDIKIGSPLRKYSELRVAELFVENAWNKFGNRFSSCNVANYRQAADNSELHWCGDCPKCANSYLLFAPFVEAEELQALFAGQELFSKPSLVNTFKGLLGIDGVIKPFECVGEIDELRYAYHLALKKGGYSQLPFDVPEASFDYLMEYPSQKMISL